MWELVKLGALFAAVIGSAIYLGLRFGRRPPAPDVLISPRLQRAMKRVEEKNEPER